MPEPRFARDREKFLESAISTIVVSGKPSERVIASVIIVAFNSDLELFQRNLISLRDQAEEAFEVIVVDNSDRGDVSSIAKNFDCQYVKLSKNYGPQIARNVGIMLAKGGLCIFLDDDAVPANDFIKSHLQAHMKKEIIGVRGRCEGRTHSQLNLLAFHYDLGPIARPSLIDLEGNSSFKRNELIGLGGFNMDLPTQGGYEGWDLSFRIWKMTSDKNALMYDPRPLIFHDYSSDPIKLLRKYLRHGKVVRKMEAGNHDFIALREAFGEQKLDLRGFLAKVVMERAFMTLCIFALGSMGSRLS